MSTYNVHFFCEKLCFQHLLESLVLLGTLHRSKFANFCNISNWNSAKKSKKNLSWTKISKNHIAIEIV